MKTLWQVAHSRGVVALVAFLVRNLESAICLIAFSWVIRRWYNKAGLFALFLVLFELRNSVYKSFLFFFYLLIADFMILMLKQVSVVSMFALTYHTTCI